MILCIVCILYDIDTWIYMYYDIDTGSGYNRQLEKRMSVYQCFSAFYMELVEMDRDIPLKRIVGGQWPCGYTT